MIHDNITHYCSLCIILPKKSHHIQCLTFKSLPQKSSFFSPSSPWSRGCPHLSQAWLPGSEKRFFSKKHLTASICGKDWKKTRHEPVTNPLFRETSEPLGWWNPHVCPNKMKDISEGHLWTRDEIQYSSWTTSCSSWYYWKYRTVNTIHYM